MSTITPQHLEDAARAAGYEIDPMMRTDSGGLCIIGADDDWMPHLDDGDAFRLAALLALDVEFGRRASAVRRHGLHLHETPCITHDGTPSDAVRAAREAIVLYAAKVGRRAGGGEA